MGLRAPEPLTNEHVLSDFCCTEPSLNQWLMERALDNHAKGFSRVFVVCPTDSMRVVGYYALSTCSVIRADVSSKMRRNAPNPIPIIILGRLAVDRAFAGQGLGSDLLSDAVKRSLNVAMHAGAKAIQVHALSDAAREFYMKWGFAPSPLAPHTLFHSLALKKLP